MEFLVFIWYIFVNYFT